MMRFACLAILLLAACSGDSDPTEDFAGVYSSQRDALCIDRNGETLKAGLITYGDGDTNCSLGGPAEIRGNTLIVRPRGDSECSVEIAMGNGVATVGTRSQSCQYYCGPGADYAGRVLRKAPDAAPKVTDFAGDKLC